MKLVIIANFAVMIPNGTDAKGKPLEIRKAYRKGMVLDSTKIPEGQCAADWLAKGCAKAA